MRKVIKLVAPTKRLRVKRPEYYSDLPIQVLKTELQETPMQDPDIVDKLVDKLIAKLKSEGILVDTKVFEAAKESVINDLSKPYGTTTRTKDNRVIRVSSEQFKRDRSHTKAHITPKEEKTTQKDLAQDIVGGLAAILGKDKK